MLEDKVLPSDYRVQVSLNLGCNAGLAELVDALDLGSSIARCESSSLLTRTISKHLENKKYE